jgi:hypothetical protein
MEDVACLCRHDLWIRGCGEYDLDNDNTNWGQTRERLILLYSNHGGSSCVPVHNMMYASRTSLSCHWRLHSHLRTSEVGRSIAQRSPFLIFHIIPVTWRSLTDIILFKVFISAGAMTLPLSSIDAK